MVVGHFLRCKVHNSGKSALSGQPFKGTPTHPGRVKHSHFEPALFKRRLKSHHIAQYGLAKRRHANQRLVPVRRLHSPRCPKDSTSSLAERRLADRVQPVKPAAPKDHLNIRRKPLRRQHRRERDCRNNILRDSQRKRRAKIKRKISAHRAAQHYHTVEFSLAIKFKGKRRRAIRHDLHRNVFVTPVNRGVNGASARFGHLMLGIICRL